MNTCTQQKSVRTLDRNSARTYLRGTSPQLTNAHVYTVCVFLSPVTTASHRFTTSHRQVVQRNAYRACVRTWVENIHIVPSLVCNVNFSSSMMYIVPGILYSSTCTARLTVRGNSLSTMHVLLDAQFLLLLVPFVVIEYQSLSNFEKTDAYEFITHEVHNHWNSITVKS